MDLYLSILLQKMNTFISIGLNFNFTALFNFEGFLTIDEHSIEK